LCTASKTFVAKEADVSNTMLLAVPQRLKQQQQDDDEDLMDVHSSEESHKEEGRMLITDSFSSFLELTVISPKLEKILFLLSKTKYKGPENEHHTRDQVTMSAHA
jgi:hypothetical protein